MFDKNSLTIWIFLTESTFRFFIDRNFYRVVKFGGYLLHRFLFWNGFLLQLIFFNELQRPSRFIWLVVAEESIRDEVKSLYIPFDCQFIVARPVGGNYRLSEFYKTSQRSALFSNDLGTWTLSSGLKLLVPPLSERRKNVHKQSLTVLYIKASNIYF